MSNEAGIQKGCRKCGETKPFEMFAGNGREKDGLHHTCRVCVVETYEARRQKTRVTDIDKTSSLSTKAFAKALERVATTPQMSGSEMKSCAKCGETKLVEMFLRNVRHADGLNRWCRDCVNAEYKAKNKTHFEENILSAHQIEQITPTVTPSKRRQAVRREPIQFEFEIPGTPEQLAREAEIRRIAREERNKKALEYLHPRTSQVYARKQEEKQAHRQRTKEIMQQQAQARHEAQQVERETARQNRKAQAEARRIARETARQARELEHKTFLEMDIKRISKSSTREEIQEYRKYRYLLRRSRIKANGGSHTRAEIRALLEAQNHQCAYCKRRVKLTEDHIIPLRQGGRHDIANICMACGRCNRQKNGRTPAQWIKRWYLLEPYNPDAP
jgi:5-methylcytosine-specific restriction endonuclease McrA